MTLRTIHRWRFREYLLIYALIRASASHDDGRARHSVGGADRWLKPCRQSFVREERTQSAKRRFRHHG